MKSSTRNKVLEEAAIMARWVELGYITVNDKNQKELIVALDKFIKAINKYLNKQKRTKQ